MDKTLNNIATSLLVVCAVTITGLILRKELFHNDSTVPVSARNVKDWQSISKQAGRWIGPRDAKVQIAVFFDFECPPCRTLKETLDVLMKRHSGELALILYNFPLKEHPHAYEAAMAAECAGLQNRYAAYHDVLYMNQTALGKKQWGLLAQLADISDAAQLEECVRSKTTSVIVDRDIELASKIGVDGMPTLVINGRMVKGNPGVDALDRLINEALDGVGE